MNKVSQRPAIAQPINRTFFLSSVFKTNDIRYPFTSPLRFQRCLSIVPKTNKFRLSSYNEDLSPQTASPESLFFDRKNHTDEKFNWFKNWWAVQAVDNLKTDRPNKIQLLNRDYIVWKGHSGEWIAMDDECPHRMAPLSEGRIEDDGNLLCSYHAWRFNETGKCVKIPHAEDEKAHSVACDSPRSSIQTYPCKTRGSLLWIWPDSGDTAHSESAKTPLPMDDDLADFYEMHARDAGLIPFIRILPYSYDVLMEEIADPARMLVSYHGIGPGFSRYNAASMDMKQVGPMRDKEIIDAVTFKNPPMAPWVHTEFRPPGTIAAFSRDDKGQPSARNCMLIRPLTTGKSMLIMVPATEKLISNTQKINFFLRPFSKLFGLYLHLKLHNRAFDSNAVLLHEQDKKIKQQGAHFAAKEDYYVPTNEDVFLMSFREWYETIGDRGAPFGGDQPLGLASELSKEQLLDRYEQYTKHSKFALDALEKVKSAIFVFKTLFAFSSVVVCGLLFKDFYAGTLSVMSISKNAKLMVSALVSVLSILVVNVLEKKVFPLFYFVDHNHADMD